MNPEADFDPAAADEAVVTHIEEDRWTLEVLHAPDVTLAAWGFECGGQFDPHVLDIVGPHLNRHGVAYKGSGAWQLNGDLWTATLYQLDERYRPR